MNEYWGNVYSYLHGGQTIIWFRNENAAKRDAERAIPWYGALRLLPTCRVHVKIKQTQ